MRFTANVGGGRSPLPSGHVTSMKEKPAKSLLNLALGFIAAASLSGCVAIKITYSPRDHTVTVDRHNDVLAIGPCGMPWNYADHFVILLQPGVDSCDGAQLEMYQHGKLTIRSGRVSLNRDKKKVTIDLTLLALEGVETAERPFAYNGTRKYVEADPAPGMVTRQWLQDFYRTNPPSYYFHR